MQQAHPGPFVRPRLLGALVLLLVLVAVWALFPEIALVALLLVAVLAEALIDLAFYVVQRRRHWR